MTSLARFNPVFLLISIAILPFVVHLTRFEANEAHRAGFLGILMLFALPAVRQAVREIKPRQRPLLYAIVLWCLILLVSTVLSIHPLRSLIGDGLRRMGLLTHLTLIVGACLIWNISGKKLWFFFWIVSLLVALQVILEATTLGDTDRILGLFGWATFTGGWLATSTLWSILGFVVHGYQNISTGQRVMVIGSWIVIGIAFVLLGTRAATLSLFGGLMVAGLIAGVLKGRRLILLGIIVATLLSASGVYILSRIEADASATSYGSLFQRFNFQVFDPFRQQVWQDSLQIMIQNPTLLRFNGEPDPLSALRPWIGYGAEAFEPPHRMVTLSNIDAVDDSIRTDRAHNIWYDTYIMYGWLGVLAMYSIYLTAIYISLKRLRLMNRWLKIDMLVGTIIAILLAWDTQFIPMAVTFGLIGGMIVGIVHTGLITRFEKVSIPTQTWIAVSLLVTHLIEIQFGFITIATAWIPWLAIGLILFDNNEEKPSINLPRWIWLAFAGAYIIRMPLDNLAFNVVLLVVALIVITIWSTIVMRQWIKIGVIWGLSAINFILLTPQLTVIWDVVALFAMLWMFHRTQDNTSHLRLTPTHVTIGLVVIVATGVWAFDILAGTYRLQATRTPLITEQLEGLNIAVRLRPYDDRLWYEAGSRNLDAGLVTNDSVAIGHAITQLGQAVNLNPYYGFYVIQLANLEANLALGTDDFEFHAVLARQYFQTATRMWSQSSDFWREWARFEWEVMDNPEQARVLINTALQLAPDDPIAQALKNEIYASIQN